MTNKEHARAAVDMIIKDLCNRRGLRQEWECIDDDIVDEIKQVWVKCITDAFEEETD